MIPDELQRDGPPEKVLLCTGKVYYDLLAYRQEHGRDDVAIVRLEQLYPLKRDALAAAIGDYPEGRPVCWVQEEPQNMGAWPFMRLSFGDSLFGRWPLCGISRAESASPATGSAASHKLEQARLVETAFSG